MKRLIGMFCLSPWPVLLMAQSALPVDDLQTLFTTPLERQIIDQNRYRTNPQPLAKTLEQPKAKEAIIEWQEVEKSYRVSGLSSSTDGSDAAWINGSIYSSGSKMEDGTRVLIRKGKLFLIPPNGKTYEALPGKTLEVQYRIKLNATDTL